MEAASAAAATAAAAADALQARAEADAAGASSLPLAASRGVAEAKVRAAVFAETDAAHRRDATHQRDATHRRDATHTHRRPLSARRTTREKLAALKERRAARAEASSSSLAAPVGTGARTGAETGRRDGDADGDFHTDVHSDVLSDVLSPRRDSVLPSRRDSVLPSRRSGWMGGVGTILSGAVDLADLDVDSGDVVRRSSRFEGFEDDSEDEDVIRDLASSGRRFAVLEARSRDERRSVATTDEREEAMVSIASRLDFARVTSSLCPWRARCTRAD